MCVDVPTGLLGAAELARDLLWPARCAGCDGPGNLLCDRCRRRLPWVDQRHCCPVCGAPGGWLVCTECDGSWETEACVAALSLEGPAARLVKVYKDGHERRLAPVLAAACACALDEASAWDRGRVDPGSLDGLCFVPSTAEAFRRRGFDPMADVAACLSAMAGVPLADALFRGRAADQRSLGRGERAANVAGTFSCAQDVSGCRLLLVDDVVTTGASVREAARTLLAAGAAGVWAVSVARTW